MGANYEKGLYKQLQETMERLEKLEAKTKKMEVEHKQEIWALKETHRIEVAALKEEIRQKDEIIAKLTAENKKLTGFVATQRVDGKLILSEAIKVLKMHA